MKLEDHVEKIRIKVEEAVKNTLDRCGITLNGNAYAQQNVNGISIGNVEQLVHSIQSEKSEWTDCFEEIVDDYAFTLFNRLVCMKVLEAHGLYPEMITQRQQHSGKSYAHYMWLENNQQYRDDAFEGLGEFINYQFEQLSLECDLFNTTIPLHMIPTATFIKEIIDLINAIDEDDQIEEEVWKQGNILSQIYEIYNNSKKAALKASGDKVEYDKVHVQSQIYTPEWVVKFLVDNSLGKLYLEMYPDSEIKDTYKIIGDFSESTREIKPLDEVKVIDPCVGSGNFLLYCFDLFYDLYMDQIENYGADYNKREVPQIIIEKNLHGIDLDERAVQLTKVGLFIKAKTKRNSVKINHYNVVSASFRLPDYNEIGNLFDAQFFSKDFSDLLQDVWKDLQQAHKFGSLLRIDEKFEDKKKELKEELGEAQLSLFTYEKAVEFDLFANNFYEKLGDAVSSFAQDDHTRFVGELAVEALTFLKLITSQYDILVSNPPYTDSGDFGKDLLKFSKENYTKKCKTNGNLYSMFVYRNIQLTQKDGYIALIHPHTLMTIKTYADIRAYLLNNCSIEYFVDYGLDRVNLFGPKILVESVFYVLRKGAGGNSIFFSISKNQQEKFKKSSFEKCIKDIIKHENNERIFYCNQEDFKLINGTPFVYELSDTFKEQFKRDTIGKVGYPVLGLKTSNNKKYLRYWWELGNVDKHEWPYYAKGGDFNRWYGNNWLRINWKNDGAEIKNEAHSQMIEKGWEFKEGTTVSTRSVKGSSARFVLEDMLFDMAASSIISLDTNDTMYVLGFANSKVFSFVLETLNNTVNKQPQDLRRIPLGSITEEQKKDISTYAQKCVDIKKQLCKFWSIEPDFENTIISMFYSTGLEQVFESYIDYYNYNQCLLSIYEAQINKAIYKVYGLSKKDIDLIENKCGPIIADYPISNEAKESFVNECMDDSIIDFIREIPIDENIGKTDFENLYKPTNDVLDFSELNKINPIEVWYQIKRIRPELKTIKDKIVLDYLSYIIAEILLASKNGIVSIFKIGNMPIIRDCLQERISNSLCEKAFVEIENYVGGNLDNYMSKYFLQQFSNYLNLFMYLPQTPYVWNIASSNNEISLLVHIQRFDENSLYAIKNEYAIPKKDQLEFKLASLKNTNSAQSQLEKEKIISQIEEINIFISKVDSLIAGNYKYVLERGVAANIAPLQEKGLISYDVLSKKQLEEYLKAEW